MNDTAAMITLQGARLTLLPSGALWWRDVSLLCVSDLHLGKSDRLARQGGPLLPPYEIRETLGRLETDLAQYAPRTVICLGDSFDDIRSAEDLGEDARLWLTRLQAGRRWIWIEGNHDPGPISVSGTHMAEVKVGPLCFRHIALPGALGEISGHYHPKAEILTRGNRIVRRCTLFDTARVILPAYGTYTGGLRWTDPAFLNLMEPGTRAALVGDPVRVVPVPGLEPPKSDKVKAAAG